MLTKGTARKLVGMASLVILQGIHSELLLLAGKVDRGICSHGGNGQGEERGRDGATSEGERNTNVSRPWPAQNMRTNAPIHDVRVPAP